MQWEHDILACLVGGIAVEPEEHALEELGLAEATEAAAHEDQALEAGHVHSICSFVTVGDFVSGEEEDGGDDGVGGAGVGVEEGGVDCRNGDAAEVGEGDGVRFWAVLRAQVGGGEEEEGVL